MPGSRAPCSASCPHGRSRIWYSRPTPEDRLGADFDARGHLAVARFDELNIPREADFYLCGPTAFMRAVSTDLAAWGVSRARMYTEVFGSGESSMPGIVNSHHRPPHSLVAPVGTRAARLVCAQQPLDSLAFEVPKPLGACRSLRVPVRWSCRTRVCHRCESGLVAGAVDYRPEPLESPADGNALICCSQPRSDVVIDL